MKYLLHTSPNSQDITRMIIIFPGIDGHMENGKPTTSNNLAKYDIFSKFTAAMCHPGTAVITTEYTGPHAWGTLIDFSILTNDIVKTLQSAVSELKERNLTIKLERIDLGSHSYGFTALFWSLANNVLGRVIGDDYRGGTYLHLFEPYGIAAMKSAKINSFALREYDVLTTAQQRFYRIAANNNPALAAESELKQLKAFDSHYQVKNLNIILGLDAAYKSIHASYGAVESEHVNITKLDKVGHGGALSDILEAQKTKSAASDCALIEFQALMNAWIASLRGIDANDTAIEARDSIQKEIESLCIIEKLMIEPKVAMPHRSESYKKIRM